MIITYLRSSSLNCFDMCQMKYFGEYTLGWRGKSGKAAEKGTIVHKVLEIVGSIKLCQQRGNKSFSDDILGRVHIHTYNLEKIVRKIYDYYISYSVNDWVPLDFKHCVKWTNMALEFNDGQFDPRNQDVFAVELPFDLEIQEPWAVYNYQVGDEILEGFFSVKGTIDHIEKLSPTVLGVTDWKTGAQRKNWATDKIKEQEDFEVDPQLRMYGYALFKKYPEIEQVIVTVYWIRAGGPFTMCWSRDELIRDTEAMLKAKFEEIRNVEIPALDINAKWKCGKFCPLGMTTFEGTDVTPIKEQRLYKRTPVGEYMSKCEQLKYTMENRPVDLVMNNMSAKGHHVGHYTAPGGVE